MNHSSRQEFRGGEHDHLIQRPGTREFRADLKKFGLKKYGSYRGWAEKLCIHPDQETLAALVEKRTRQLEYLCNDPEDADPRSSLLLAAWESVFGHDTPLTASECGWDPSRP